ncbi:hypothetical protein MRX96_044780 [Rhipicephalus microplus]
MLIYFRAAPFLLACFAFLLFVALPVMRLESNLAQFVGDGNRGIFSTVPLFFGIGYALTAYVLSHVVADTMALADALALLMSLTKSFDWHHNCPGGWMTRNFSCYAIRPGSAPCKLARDDLTDTFRHDTTSEGIPVSSGNKVILIPSEQYKDEATGCIPDLPDTAAPYHFRRQTIWEPGAIDSFWAEPVFAIAVIWLLVFAITHKGFLKLKAFFYAIVLLHIVTTLMLLARASTLNGASWGLRLFFHANWSSLTSLEGGAKGLSLLCSSQNNFRLFLLALELIVFLQLYGARRLEVDSQLMTGGTPGFFVKFCWTSIIPLALMVLLSAKAFRPVTVERQHPVFLTALMAWVQMVEFSFIPVYAFVFVFHTKLLVPESGTFYKSRALSSLLRYVRSRDTTGNAVSPPPRRTKDRCGTGKIRSIFRKNVGATNKQDVSPVASVSHAETQEKLAPLPMNEGGRATPYGSSNAVPVARAATPDCAALSGCELNRRAESPNNLAIYEGRAAGPSRTMKRESFHEGIPTKASPPRELVRRKDKTPLETTVSPDLLNPQVKTRHYKRYPGSPPTESKSSSSSASSQAGMLKSRRRFLGVNTVLAMASFFAAAQARRATVSPKNTSENAEVTSPAAIASFSSTRRESSHKKTETSDRELLPGKNKAADSGVHLPAIGSPSSSRKPVPSPSEEAVSHRRCHDGGVTAASPNMLEKKQPSKKGAAQHQPRGGMSPPPMSSASHVENAHHAALFSPAPKANSNAAARKVTAKKKRQPGFSKGTARDRSAFLALCTGLCGVGTSASQARGYTRSPFSTEREEPDRAIDEGDRLRPLVTAPPLPPRESQNIPVEKARSPKLTARKDIHDVAASKDRAASRRADTTRAVISAQLPETPSTDGPISLATPGVPALEVAATVNHAGQAKGLEAGKRKGRGKSRPPPDNRRLSEAKIL